MLEFMNPKNVSTMIVDRFSKVRYPKLNASFRTNFFAIDELGLPIRRELEGHDNKFGWKKVNEKFYHFRVNELLIGQVNDDELRRITLDSIRHKWPKEFMDGSQFLKQLRLANEEYVREQMLMKEKSE